MLKNFICSTRTTVITRLPTRFDLCNKQIHTSNHRKMAELLAEQTLVVNRAGEKAKAGDYLKGKVVGIYFSASWCPPCRAFTPKLKKFYEELKAAGKDFEVIFVSRDRESDDLIAYYKDHQAEWTYLEYGDPKIQELLEKYEVKTIPTFRIIKADGKVVVQEARTELEQKGGNAQALFEEWKALYDA